MEDIERIQQLHKALDECNVYVEDGDTVHFRDDNGEVGSIKLEPDEVDRFNNLIDTFGNEQMEGVLKSDVYENLPDSEKESIYNRVIRNAVRSARGQIELDRYNARNK